MLTKDDLKKLKEIVREEIEAEGENLKNEINGTVSMSGIKIRSELKEVKTRLKNVEVGVKKLQKDLKTVSDTLDKDIIKTQKRVNRVERHLHLPEVEFA